MQKKSRKVPGMGSPSTSIDEYIIEEFKNNRMKVLDQIHKEPI